ncbi:hypothetical protein OQA88_11917 [Cercophora sp. LCS_1]
MVTATTSRAALAACQEVARNAPLDGSKFTKDKVHRKVRFRENHILGPVPPDTPPKSQPSIRAEGVCSQVNDERTPERSDTTTAQTTKDASVKTRRRFRDSACVLTPPSLLQPTAARLASPSLSPVHHPEALDHPVLNRVPQRPHRSETTVISPSVVESGCDLQDEQVIEQLQKRAVAKRKSTALRRSSSGRRSTEWSDITHIEIENVVQDDSFALPPRNLEQEAKDVAEFLKTLPGAPFCREFEHTLESVIDEHADQWKPFIEQVEKGQRYLADLKGAMLEKLATKQEIERNVLQLRINLKRRRRAGMSIQGGRQGLQVFYSNIAKLDRQIANFRTKWNKKALELNNCIERAFELDFKAEVGEAMFDEVERLAGRQYAIANKRKLETLTSKIGCLTISGAGSRKTPLSLAPLEYPAVPTWFEAVESAIRTQGIMELRPSSPETNYRALMTRISQLEREIDDESKLPQKVEFTKNWHEKSPSWPFKSWQDAGGWWVCRTGPGSSEMEERCRVCPVKRDTRQTPSQPTAASSRSQAVYNKIMGEIEKVMKTEAEQDKKVYKARLDMEGANLQRKQSAYRFGWDGGYLGGW